MIDGLKSRIGRQGRQADERGTEWGGECVSFSISESLHLSLQHPLSVSAIEMSLLVVIFHYFGASEFHMPASAVSDSTTLYYRSVRSDRMLNGCTV